MVALGECGIGCVYLLKRKSQHDGGSDAGSGQRGGGWGAGPMEDRTERQTKTLPLAQKEELLFLRWGGGRKVI